MKPSFVASAVPFDVRLMNAVSGIVYGCAALALVAAGLLALARLPVFDLRAIRLDGDVRADSLAAIRANALPRLKGNFWSLDLRVARAAFEAVPWVRRAVVRRVWPDQLVVTLESHRAAAFWHGRDGRDASEDEGADDQLVDVDGDVFEANPGDVDDGELPVFAGPAGSAVRMLALYRELAPVFARIDAAVEVLRLSGRGSWRVRLDSGTTVELGRGGPDGDAAAVLERCRRFVGTLADVEALYPHRRIEYADLRHADGYALRIKGVSTTLPPAPAARPPIRR